MSEKESKRRRKMKTHKFGVSGRESHDSTPFYSRKMYKDARTLLPPKEVTENPLPSEYLGKVFLGDAKEVLEKVYNGIAYEESLDYDVSFDEMLKVLFKHRYHEEVGAYFRNQWLKVKQGSPEEYERIYHRRNVSENLHSILKEQLLFDKNLNVKGFEAIEFYARQFLVTLLFVALARVENGVSEGLAKVNPTAFS